MPTGYYPRPSLEERFWAKVDKCGPDECWPWKGCVDHFGYGWIRDEGNARKAHRVSWKLNKKRPVPPGKDVLHKCDNPPCVNPRHLKLGNLLSNMADMVAKGRQGRGSRQGHAKLNEQQVLTIKRALKAGQRGSDLARTYNVSAMAISDIKRGARWAWL